MVEEREPRHCDFCKSGRLAVRLEEIAFRQCSDKGEVHCRVQVPVGTCSHCGLKWLDPDCDQLLESAFRCEYEKLP